LFKDNKSAIINDTAIVSSHSRNSIKIPRCVRQLDHTSAAMATAPDI